MYYAIISRLCIRRTLNFTCTTSWCQCKQGQCNHVARYKLSDTYLVCINLKDCELFTGHDIISRTKLLSEVWDEYMQERGRQDNMVYSHMVPAPYFQIHLMDVSYVTHSERYIWHSMGQFPVNDASKPIGNLVCDVKTISLDGCSRMF